MMGRFVQRRIVRAAALRGPAMILGFAASACITLDGCGGSSTAATPRAAAPQRAASVTFTMRWPGTNATASARKPRFVSPSAQSVVVEVNASGSPAGPITFANNPSLNGAPATSTITIDAPPGRDDFSIALFDQPQVAGETSTAGNQIGRAEITQTIASGVLNKLDAVIAGIVGGVRVAPAANQPFVETLSATPPQAYALAGDQPATFVLTAVDPDGNVIVPVDTSPAHVDTPQLALAASGATSELTVAPVAGDPSRFVVTATSPKTAPGSALALRATATDGAGDHAQSNVAIDERSAVYVTYGSGSSTTVAVFDDAGNRIALPPGAFAGLSDPGAIAYDADDRRVFIADSGKIAAFDASGNAVAGYSAPVAPGANGIAYDRNAKLIYVSSPGTVSIFTPNGAPPGTGPPAFPAAHAAGIAYVPGATPQLAVANADATTPSFDLYAEDGTPVASYPIGGTAPPTAIAYAPSSAMLYVASGTTIASFALSGAPGPAATDAHQPAALACDLDLGELYAIERSTGTLAAYALDLSGIDAAHGIPALSAGPNPKGVALAF